MKIVLTTISCFLLAICRVSAQSPNTDLQPVNSKEIKTQIKIPIFWYSKQNVPNFSNAHTLYIVTHCSKHLIQDKGFNVTGGFQIDSVITFVDGIRVITPPIYTFLTNITYPRNIRAIGTPAAYSYDNKYVYKPTQPF